MPLIRTATELDLQAITEIYAHYVRNSATTFEMDPPEQSEMDRRRREIQSQGLPYLVAEVDGFVPGYAYAARYRPRPGYRFTVEDSIYIHPEFASIRLHAKFGFRQVGVLRAVGRKFGRWIDTVIMQRALYNEAGSPT